MSDPWLQNLFLLSCKGGLLALCLGIVLLLLRRHVSPAWRHGLWLLVLLRFALPDIGTSSLSLNQVTELPAVQLSFEPAAVMAPIEPVQELQVSDASVKPARLPPAPAPVVMEIQPASPPVITAPEAGRAALMPAQWLLGIWVLGMLAVLGVMLTLHLRLVARLRLDASPAPEAVAEILSEACALAGISHRPRLIITEAVHSPALFGVVSPAILLPRELAHENDPAALKLVFLHELAHLQRRDLWAQMATSLILALHWFNPVVWWAARRMRAEAEMAADARALACTDVAEAHRFGTVLLGFASRATASWMLWLAAATVLGISENKHDLRRRIEALKDIARGRRTRWIIGLSAFLLLAITGLTKAPAEDAKKDAVVAKVSTAVVEESLITVSGIIVDESGKPVSEAECSLNSLGTSFKSQQRTTGADGRFRFDEIPPFSTLTLTARHADYTNATAVNFNGHTQVAEHRLVLPKATWIVGRITDKRDGKPIRDARVFYGREQPEGIGAYRWTLPSVHTSETGHYRLQVKSPDKAGIIVRAWAQDMMSKAAVITLNGAETTYDAALEPVQRIPGKVVNAEGQPVKDAFVWVVEDSPVLDERKEPITLEWLKDKTKRARLADGRMFFSLGTSVEGGAFRLHEVDPLLRDKLWVAALHPEEGIGFMRARDLRPGALIKLKRWASFGGRVMKADGTALVNQKIDLIAGFNFRQPGATEMPPGISHRQSITTDADGNYEVERILPHAWMTGVAVNDKFERIELVAIGSGSSSAKVIRLLPPLTPAVDAQMRTVRGRIVTPAGHPVISDAHSISISLRSDAGTYHFVDPDKDGRFITNPLRPDIYTLTVMPSPRKSGMMNPLKAGRSLRFKLEAAGDGKSVVLNDIVLEDADFAFQSAVDRQATSGPKPIPRLEGAEGHVELLVVDADKNPVPGIKIEALDFVNQARLRLDLKDVAQRIPAATTDARGIASLAFPRAPAAGVSASGLLLRGTGLNGSATPKIALTDAMRTQVQIYEAFPLDASVALPLASWTLSSISEIQSGKSVVNDTQLVGEVRSIPGYGFLIQGTQQDGSALFSPLQLAPLTKGQPFKGTIPMSPGLSLKGKINDLPAGEVGEGWVIATVMVRGGLELNEWVKGFPPTVFWRAWTRVHPDGSFGFAALPRGGITLSAAGSTWACQDAGVTDPAADTRDPQSPLVLRTNLTAVPVTKQRAVQVLHPDGKAISGATIVVFSMGSFRFTASQFDIDHVVSPADAAAYERYKARRIPGHQVTTDSEGKATVGGLVDGKAACFVHWTDPKTFKIHREKVEVLVSPGVDEPQVFKLTGEEL
ncbi:M56 family metallopeptidase [Brevifollis gellanilyticus]|nr:M56 family metallopeptidase [Brevifollis gellanilyticus]